MTTIGTAYGMPASTNPGAGALSTLSTAVTSTTTVAMTADTQQHDGERLVRQPLRLLGAPPVQLQCGVSSTTTTARIQPNTTGRFLS